MGRKNLLLESKAKKIVARFRIAFNFYTDVHVSLTMTQKLKAPSFIQC